MRRIFGNKGKIYYVAWEGWVMRRFMVWASYKILVEWSNEGRNVGRGMCYAWRTKQVYTRFWLKKRIWKKWPRWRRRYRCWIILKYTQKNGAGLKVNKKFIAHLTRAQRTPSAATTVQVSHALLTILQCVHPVSHDTHPHGNQIHPRLGVACPL